MVCAQCGEREAIVFIRRSGGRDDGCDIVLCESCARNRGIVAAKGNLGLNFDELIGNGLDPSQPRAVTSLCPSCGTSLAQILREGRLGCASCADSFSGELVRFFRPAPGVREEGRSLLPEAVEGAGKAEADPAELEDRLAKALTMEEYEKAALLRDAIERSKKLGSVPERQVFPREFPLRGDSFFRAPGPDSDVVLWSSATLSRGLEGIPFPGSPNGSSSPSRSFLLERLVGGGAWRSSTMQELGPVLRRSLAERGLLPRSYAAEDEAVLASKPRAGIFALLDEGDHLRLRAFSPGFDPGIALATALSESESIGRSVNFAYRAELGWICARISSCGLGASISALVHIPAISASGLRDRLFRALMADGAVIRGFYSTSEDSSGSLYEISVEPSDHDSLKSMVRSLDSAVSKATQSERRARTEISEKERIALVDAEGRAFGIALHCSLLGAEEAAGIVSTLRLASLRGSLPGVEPRVLASLLLSLGPAALAYARGLDEHPEGRKAELLRSEAVKAALAGAEYTGIQEEDA